MTSTMVIFDCDGTLVDSQYHIAHVVEETFRKAGFEVPTRMDIRKIIGLSLPEAMAMLRPDVTGQDRNRLVTLYKELFRAYRKSESFEPEPLFPGIQSLLEKLDEVGVLMGVATGKSMAGLKNILREHDLTKHFISLQTADYHPSKPHPSMIHECLRDSGSDEQQTIMVGDTSFDMAMAKNAGVFALGVDWGYHDVDTLKAAGADHVVSQSADISDIVSAVAQGGLDGP